MIPVARRLVLKRMVRTLAAFVAGSAVVHPLPTVPPGGATALQVLEDLRCFPVAVRQVFGEYPRSIDGGE